MQNAIPKAYEPKDYEDQMYGRWEASGYFNPDVCVERGVTAADAEPFTIVLPPPNVTGTLHMGHAAMLAIEDVMIRYARMRGKRTLWLPGTDHAAVATESKVEGLLIKEEGFKKPKEELGRDAFLARVHKFAQDSHDTIVNQSKKMGSSLDWSREAYTLDDQRNLAVRTVFKQMYDDGLIYRGYRVVNWSVKGQSTCSDDELVYVERPAKLFTFKYSHDFPIPIATTRPETKLGDTAVAVHPEGKWKEYIGQTFRVADFGQPGHTLKIRVIADAGIDEAFGTGALGVTTAHSPIDFEMYMREKARGNDIGIVQVIDEQGRMTWDAGSEYHKLSVLEARERVVSWLKLNDLLISEEDIKQNVGTSDRFGDVVEPLPKVQWFVDVNKKVSGKGRFAGREVSLKEMMAEVVRDGSIEILPDRFNRTYFSWIDNLRDWCISRQVWFGHQIPAFYPVQCDENKESVAFYSHESKLWDISDESLRSLGVQGFWGRTGDGSRAFSFETLSGLIKRGLLKNKADIELGLRGLTISMKAKIHVGGSSGDFEFQDPDSLDTWFSSGLWTFSTLGWPENTKDFQTFHPTSVLETGYDIIFFWVARMILMTTYTLGEVPFKTVYLHGLVRDEQGRKMSKTLGNIINPLDMIAQYGTDATRLSLLLGSTPGNDVKLSEEKIASFRNFTNKLWNIGRYILSTEGVAEASASWECKTLADRWIVARMRTVTEEVTRSLDTHAFSYAGERLRDFTWSELADWYLEASKAAPNPALLRQILGTLIRLWHPFMPFVTEVIGDMMRDSASAEFIMVSRWPDAVQIPADDAALREFTMVQDAVTAVRAMRQTYHIEPGVQLTMQVIAEDGAWLQLAAQEEVVKKLARLSAIERITELPQNAAATTLGWGSVSIPLEGQIDVAAQRDRVQKELDDVTRYIDTLNKKLGNEDFVNRAAPAIVEKEREKLAEATSRRDALAAQLAQLG